MNIYYKVGTTYILLASLSSVIKHALKSTLLKPLTFCHKIFSHSSVDIKAVSRFTLSYC